jgi:hypothetical protein
MKRLWIILPLIMLALTGMSQSEEALRKIESAKIALLTDRMNLTPDQAEKFWPIYNEYSLRVRENRMEYDQLRRSIDPQSASEDENKRLLEVGMRVKQNQLQLEQQYSERMLNVISNRQMVNMRRAEEDFRKMLIEKVRERRQQNERMQQNRNRNNQRLNNS